MFESLFENLKFVDEGTMQGAVFAIGIAVYYLCKKLFTKNDRY